MLKDSKHFTFTDPIHYKDLKERADTALKTAMVYRKDLYNVFKAVNKLEFVAPLIYIMKDGEEAYWDRVSMGRLLFTTIPFAVFKDERVHLLDEALTKWRDYFINKHKPEWLSSLWISENAAFRSNSKFFKHPIHFFDVEMVYNTLENADSEWIMDEFVKRIEEISNA